MKLSKRQKQKQALEAQVSKCKQINQLFVHHDHQVASCVDLEEHMEEVRSIFSLFFKFFFKKPMYESIQIIQILLKNSAGLSKCPWSLFSDSLTSDFLFHIHSSLKKKKKV